MVLTTLFILRSILHICSNQQAALGKQALQTSHHAFGPANKICKRKAGICAFKYQCGRGNSYLPAFSVIKLCMLSRLRRQGSSVLPPRQLKQHTANFAARKVSVVNRRDANQVASSGNPGGCQALGAHGHICKPEKLWRSPHTYRLLSVTLSKWFLSAIECFFQT